MRRKSGGFVSWRRPRPWLCFCAELSAILLLAGTGECLQAAGHHARSATMAARIDAPRAPSVRLASLARQRELSDGRQTLGDDASTYRRASLLGAATPWPGTAASLLDTNRTAASAQLPTNVAAISGRDSWGKGARFAVGAVAINSSNGRGHRAETAIPESLAANFQVRPGTTRSVGLLRADDLVRTGGVKSVGIDAPASSGVQGLGLLSNSSSLNSGSTGAGSPPPWSAPALDSSTPLNLVR